MKLQWAAETRTVLRGGADRRVTAHLWRPLQQMFLGMGLKNVLVLMN